MTVINIEHYGQIPVPDRPHLAENLRAVAKGHTFQYETVVGDKTYVIKESLAKKLLEFEITPHRRTLEQLQAEAKPVAHPLLSKLAQEQIATPPQVKEPIYASDEAMKNTFAQAQAAAKEGKYEETLDPFVKNIVERRAGLVHQDKDYVKKMEQMGSTYSQLAAHLEKGEKSDKQLFIKNLSKRIALWERYYTTIEKVTPDELVELLSVIKDARTMLKSLKSRDLNPTDATNLLLFKKVLDKMEKKIGSKLSEAA